jgi:hypothetical protein
MVFNYSAFILSISLTPQLLRDIPADAGFQHDVTTQLGAAIRERPCRWLGLEKQTTHNRQDKLEVENIVQTSMQSRKTTFNSLRKAHLSENSLA